MMFSLQPSDELVFGAQIPPTKDEDLMINDHNFINFGSVDSSRVMGPAGLTRQTTSESNMMRVVHRDVERKRRRKMSNLYLTLNSLLPAEFKKGKSGVCDQMQEAQNYIKTLQNKNQHLRIRRDRLLQLSQNRMGSSEHDRVIINPLQPDGMEILMTSVSSGILCALEVLLAAEREVDVVSCVSTPTNGGFLHKIHIQGRVIDASVLHDKLSKAMK